MFGYNWYGATHHFSQLVADHHTADQKIVRQVLRCHLKGGTNSEQGVPDLNLCPRLARNEGGSFVPPVTKLAHDGVEVIDGSVEI